MNIKKLYLRPFKLKFEFFCEELQLLEKIVSTTLRLLGQDYSVLDGRRHQSFLVHQPHIQTVKFAIGENGYKGAGPTVKNFIDNAPQIVDK